MMTSEGRGGAYGSNKQRTDWRRGGEKYELQGWRGGRGGGNNNRGRGGGNNNRGRGGRNNNWGRGGRNNNGGRGGAYNNWGRGGAYNNWGRGGAYNNWGRGGYNQQQQQPAGTPQQAATKRLENVPDVDVEIAVQEHKEAMAAYSDVLNSVWGHMRDEGWGQDMVKTDTVYASTVLPRGHGAFTMVDTSFWNHDYMKKYSNVLTFYQMYATAYPISFPRCIDIGNRMHDLGRAVEVQSGIFFCKKTFRVSSGDKSVPASLNKCLYFVQAEGTEHTQTLTHACLSFELSAPQATDTEQNREAGRNRHAFLSMKSGSEQYPCNYPFMVVFNSANADEIAMIGENTFDRIQPASISNKEQERLEATQRPLPLKRSLWGTFWDRIMPVPHLRMYMILRGRSGAEVERWELLGHIGDVVSAYAVYLKDGTVDCVLARSRMAQFDVVPRAEMAEDAQDSGQQTGHSRQGSRRKNKKNKEPSEPVKVEPPPDIWDQDEFPALGEAQQKRQVQQRLVFEDVGDYDEDLLFLGGEFDLGGFSSELEDDLDEEEQTSCSAPFGAGAAHTTSIWAAPAAAPWVRSWQRPVVRGD